MTLEAVVDTTKTIQAVKLSWVAPKPVTDQPITFNLYRAVGTAKMVRTRENLTGTTLTITADLPSKSVQHFGISAVEGGKESKLSNVQTITMP